jgi:hypothetical protein
LGTLKPKFRFLASLRLAIFVITGMAVIAAVGTITEARYDAEVAQKLVYQSTYMYIVMGLLIVNLIGVMVDRWPWKQHHIGFVTAHIGIITLLFGSWLTQKYGIDGTLAFEAGQERKSIQVKDRELTIFSSLDGNSFRTMYSEDADFLRHPPTPDHPFVVHLGQDEMRFLQYEQFAFRESEISQSDSDQDGPAIRFQLENPNVNLTQWLRRENQHDITEVDLGPAKVILAQTPPPPANRNEVVLITKPNSPNLDYVIYNKDNSIRKKGQVKQSETLETGWMGLKFRLLRYLDHSKEAVTYKVSPTASPISTSALRFTFRGNEYWLGLDSMLRVYLADRMYLIRYGHRQLELAFPLKLIKFTVGYDEGTEKAASYESLVNVPTKGLVKISMNEPLQFQGFTFYQSSFEKNERGEPVASILSANHDPGRWIKYAGSMMMVLGSILLFYFKRVQWFSHLKKKGSGS